jgi:phospholipid/cholesterol/gamma-HCH transport system substrate-binding protein
VAKLTQAAKVGLFFLASAGAGFVVYRQLGGGVRGGDGYTIHGYIKDATGLANHSRVTIAGIPVGTIEAIKLENGRARVDVHVQKDVALFDNATLGKKSASLLGESVVVLTAGTDDKRRLKEGDEVSSIVEAPTTDQILADVARIADRVKLVSERLAESVGSQEGGDNMKKILANLADATEALNVTIRENRESIKQTITNVDRITKDGEPKVAQILENVRAVTGDLRELMAKNDPKSPTKEPGDLRQTVERINRASSSLESSLAHIDSVAGRIDRGEGTIGKLTKDDALINEVQGVAEGVNDYVSQLGRVQAVVGLRADYNFLAGTIKNFVELRLQPREDKYYVIELINDPRGKTNFTQADVDTTNPNEPSHYRTTTTTTTDAFRVSVQYARKLNVGSGISLTGRFGVKESTGGLGLDIHLLNNRLAITQDFFGFGESTKGRYRVFLGYEFLNRLWLIGGVDHLFLADRRDYFLGLQLKFTDEDLRAVLPFSGGAFTSGGR